MSDKVIKTIVYGLGGFDETKPNDNVVETIYYTAEELAELEAIAAKEATRTELLARLGITADEAKLLLGSN
jgi:hypothetical protein